MKEILIFLGALPEMIKLAKEMFEWVKKIAGDDPKKFIGDLHDAMAEIRKSKDPAKLQDLIRRL